MKTLLRKHALRSLVAAGGLAALLAAPSTGAAKLGADFTDPLGDAAGAPDIRGMNVIDHTVRRES